MRILFANNLCGHFGGVEQVVAHTAPALTQRGHECHLAFARPGSGPEEFAKRFASVSRCSEFGGPPEETRGESFETIASRIKPDVVFVHKVAQLPKGFEGLTGFRKVILVHDHDLWCPTGLGYDRRTRKMCSHTAGWPCYLSLAFLEKSSKGPLPFRFAGVHSKVAEMRRYHAFDAILPNSNFIREKLLANGFPSARTTLCHPVLNQPDVEMAPLPDEPVVLFVGSLIRGKGVDLLLRALTELRCAYRLNIVGTGKSEGELRTLAASLGIDKAVNFAGWVPNEQVAQYYRAAKVVAVPSAWPEPFGLVGLEAMRHGRPVASFRIGGIPDWLSHEKTGLLSPPLDVAAYGRSLERLLTEPGLAAQLGAEGGRQVRSRFRFDDYIDQLEGHLASGVAHA